MEQSLYSNSFKSGNIATGAPIVVANTASFGTDAGSYQNWIAGRTFSASIGLKF
jgi:hypothetical protein